MKYLITALIFIGMCHQSSAQCEANEIEVFIQVSVDAWGYETYWELNETGEVCGETPLFTASNEEVGCDGGGDQDAPAGGYDNNTLYLEGPFCLTLDSVYDIIFIDDYGDGGLIYEVIQDGISTNYFVGTGEGNTFSFTAGDLTPAFIPGDRPCESLSAEVDGDNLIVETTEATVSPNEITPPLLSCAAYGAWCDSNGGASNTMWVTFIAPEDGAVEISTCQEGTDFDTAVAVYEAEDCSDFSTYTLISSNDDSYGGCPNGNGFAGVCYANCLNPGEPYLIQIDGWDGESGNVELSVSTYLEDPEIFGLTRDIPCANVKGEFGSLIIPQVVGMGINYDISWSGPFDFQSTEHYIEDIPAGDYTCVITNECGFSGTQTYTITVPDPVSNSVSVTNSSCPEVADGALEITSGGGVAPYEYLWSGPNDYTAAGNSLEQLLEGTYIVEVIDDNDCEYTNTVQVLSDNILEFSLGDDETVCLNEYLLFEGPEGFLIYDWQDGSDGSSFILPAWQFGEGEHNITLTVSNEIGCVYTDVALVTVENCTGIDEHEAVQWQVYPNPSSGQVTVQLNGAIDNATVHLTDTQGRLVFEQNLGGLESVLDLSALSKGVYTLSILNSEQFVIGQDHLILN